MKKKVKKFAMGGLGNAMGGLGGAIGGMNVQQAVRGGMGGMGGMNAQQAAAQTAQDLPYQAGMSRGMGRGSSLPNSSGMKNPRGPNPQFMGDMLRKAQQIAGEQGAMATQGDPLQGLRSKTPGNLPAMGNLRNIFAQTAGAKGQVFKKGGKVKAPKSVSSASKRADGIAMKGKTKGRIV